MSNENEEMIANINSNPESDLSSFTKKALKIILQMNENKAMIKILMCQNLNNRKKINQNSNQQVKCSNVAVPYIELKEIKERIKYCMAKSTNVIKFKKKKKI